MVETPADDANEAGTDADAGEDEDGDQDHESGPIVVINYRGVIEEQTWQDFKDQVPRSERLEDYLNDLIRNDAYDGNDPPHRTANSTTPNTITTTEAQRDQRQQ